MEILVTSRERADSTYNILHTIKEGDEGGEGGETLENDGIVDDEDEEDEHSKNKHHLHAVKKEIHESFGELNIFLLKNL